MSFYDADDFDEEFVDEDEEDANAFEVTMSAVFEARGKDTESALASARLLAEESIYDGDWELDDGKLIGEPDARGQVHFEFSALSLIEADSTEEAMDIAATELTYECDFLGRATPGYLND